MIVLAVAVIENMNLLLKKYDEPPQWLYNGDVHLRTTDYELYADDVWI